MCGGTPNRSKVSPPGEESIEARIRAFEHRLEKRLQRFDGKIAREIEAAPGLDPAAERRLVEALARVEERVAKLTTLVDELEEEERQGLLESIIGLGDSVQRAFSFDTYRRTFNNLGMRNRRFDVDEFGLESDARESILPLVRFLFERWWRVSVTGAEHVPFEGPGLIVGNHSGVLPWDGVMISHAIEQSHPAQRRARFLAEDWVATLPFASAMIRRLGQRFGRGGFVQIALRTGAPMIPVAAIGAEESHPVLYKSNWLANALRAPFFPVSPTWPLLGPLGLVPLPSKWQIRFGEPIPSDAYRPEDADNEFLVNQLKEKVRATIQTMIDDALAERRSIWFG
jgi:1-acyl-sn-glycerol-3-phosphate acyltransferase